MKALTVFYLAGCPYCRNARRALAELIAEDPARGAVPVTWIEESEQPAVADRYDYYRVPSVFLDGEKLYEASPAHGYEEIKAHFAAALDRARLTKGKTC